MLEYVLAMAALTLVIGILWTLVGATVSFSARTENLVTCEYP